LRIHTISTSESSTSLTVSFIVILGLCWSQAEWLLEAFRMFKERNLHISSGAKRLSSSGPLFTKFFVEPHFCRVLRTTD
jgi:hypothetical protein